MRSSFLKKYCPKCGGNIYLDEDYYGWYEQCLQCGYTYDIESTLEIFNEGNAVDKEIPVMEEPVIV